jgi:peptidoglycan/LPS O-acetylase OafA/YrhL
MSTPPQNKYLGIELVRFLAALSILIFHYQHFYFIQNQLHTFDIKAQPFYNAISFIYEYGNFSVNIFWYISGYIFFVNYQDRIRNKMIHGKDFFIARFSRLYPLHFATLLLVAILQYFYFQKTQSYFVYPYNDAYHFILHLFMIPNLGLEKGFSFNGPIWSVSIEILIYGFFYLSTRHITYKYLGEIITLFLCLILHLLTIKSPVIDCLRYFYIGGLGALIFSHLSENQKLKKLNIAMLLIIIACIFIFSMRHYAFMLLIFSSPFIFYNFNYLKIGPKLTALILNLGNTTYASYLIHFPLQLLTMILLLHFDIKIPTENVYFFLIYILATLIISHFIYMHFEKKTQALIRLKYANGR